jgi:hypothetical protein
MIIESAFKIGTPVEKIFLDFSKHYLINCVNEIMTGVATPVFFFV